MGVFIFKIFIFAIWLSYAFIGITMIIESWNSYDRWSEVVATVSMLTPIALLITLILYYIGVTL